MTFRLKVDCKVKNIEIMYVMAVLKMSSQTCFSSTMFYYNCLLFSLAVVFRLPNNCCCYILVVCVNNIWNSF